MSPEIPQPSEKQILTPEQLKAERQSWGSDLTLDLLLKVMYSKKFGIFPYPYPRGDFDSMRRIMQESFDIARDDNGNFLPLDVDTRIISQIEKVADEHDIALGAPEEESEEGITPEFKRPEQLLQEILDTVNSLAEPDATESG